MAVSVSTLIAYSGPICDACLLVILTLKKRWKRFPAFSGLIAFDFAYSILSDAFGVGASRLSYALVDGVSLILQVAVVFELLRNIMPRSSTLAAKGRRMFAVIAACGLLLAALTTFLIKPAGLTGSGLLESEADLFASLMICETVIAIMLAAQKVGVGWRNHLIAIAQGLMIWALSIVVVEGLGPYLVFHHALNDGLYYARSIIYLGTLTYWSVALWREEPARKPISPEMRKYIVALHDQVQYDLGKVGH